jgi:archaellum component FlaF (FlaF/FlaG flagellin family)
MTSECFIYRHRCHFANTSESCVRFRSMTHVSLIVCGNVYVSYSQTFQPCNNINNKLYLQKQFQSMRSLLLCNAYVFGTGVHLLQTHTNLLS